MMTVASQLAKANTKHCELKREAWLGHIQPDSGPAWKKPSSPLTHLNGVSLLMQGGDSTPAKPFHAIVTTTNYSENPKNKSCLTQSPFIWHPIPLNTDTLPAAVSSVPALSMVLNRGWFAHNRLSFWPYTG